MSIEYPYPPTSLIKNIIEVGSWVFKQKKHQKYQRNNFIVFRYHLTAFAYT